VINLSTLSSDELINLRIAVEKEMRSRSISFSVGEIGEAVAINYFRNTAGLSNLTASAPGSKNVDALSRNGDRYSIKTVQRGSKTGTVYPDEQNPDKQLFEYLLITKLAPDFTLEALYQFSWEQFLQIRAWDKRMNAWYVPISKSRLKIGMCLYIKQ